MFQIHSEQNLNELNNLNIPDENIMPNNQSKKNKYIYYENYLKLKEAYLSNQEICIKTKEDNDKLNSILSSYQEEISKFNDYKQNINKAFEIMQTKFNELYNENKSLKMNYNEKIKNFNEIINELNDEIKQYQIELSEKNNEIEELKNLKNDVDIKNQNLIKQKHDELILQKEELKSKEEELKSKEKQLKIKEEELKSKEEELKIKEENIKRKELELKDKEISFNQKDIKIKEKESILKLEENEIKKEKKQNEELYQKLHEELNLKEKQIYIEINKINENKLVINETIEKLNVKEMYLDKEINKIKEFGQNLIAINEINIEYKLVKKKNINYNIENIDNLEIIQKKNISINFNAKEPQIYTFKNNTNLNSKLNLVNKALLDNYFNTINIGYNNVKENIEESFEEINNLDVECEPTPSFLLCLQKSKE